jgi:hypothetical protein
MSSPNPRADAENTRPNRPFASKEHSDFKRYFSERAADKTPVHLKKWGAQDPKNPVWAHKSPAAKAAPKPEKGEKVRFFPSLDAKHGRLGKELAKAAKSRESAKTRALESMVGKKITD